MSFGPEKCSQMVKKRGKIPADKTVGTKRQDCKYQRQLQGLLPYLSGGVCVSHGSRGICCQGFSPLVGSSMAKWSWVRDQKKRDLKNLYEQKMKGTCQPARVRFTAGERLVASP